MKKIEQFQITDMTLSGFKSYAEPTELVFGSPTAITGGNSRGKSSVADAIAFAVTGLPFFGERGIDRLHSEGTEEPLDIYVRMRFVDGGGAAHELTRTRHKNRMTITYDGYEIRQLDLTDMFGERDVFLSIANPLYFIEELGDEGKNLLERHLPLISHEAVLEQLSEPVREHIKDEPLSCPDVYLKNRREQVRELDKEIIYLQGQKDLVELQKADNGKALAQLKERAQALQNEVGALEERRYAGLDIAGMQARMVELSEQYDEAARDGLDASSEEDRRIRELERQIHLRRAERYQSQYAQALAEATAKYNELVTRYKREAATYNSFVPGSECPTCHRPITEESLPEVQREMQRAITAIAAAGREQQSQLDEIKDLDQKSAKTFEAFQADDIAKWEAELVELKSRDAGAEEKKSCVEVLREQIQQLTSSLEYGNLSQEEYDRLQDAMQEQRQTQAQLGAFQAVSGRGATDFDALITDAQMKKRELEKLMADVAVYVSARAKLTFSQLKMNLVSISLYDVVKSTGERKDAFRFTFKGRQYKNLSRSEKIRAGMEVSELMKRLTGRNYPVFVDDMESVEDLANVQPTGQIIMAKFVSGAPLQVRAVKPIKQVQTNMTQEAA